MTSARKLASNRRYRERNRDAVLYHKRNARLRRHGLEPADLTRMLEEQDYLCAICAGGPLLRDGRGRWSAHIDHCHDCGAVRSLLCKRCNTALGFIESDETAFWAVVAYHVDHHVERGAHPTDRVACWGFGRELVQRSSL